MLTKKELTKLFLEQAEIEFDDRSFKVYHTYWWHAPLSPVGFRLTAPGAEFLDTVLKLQKYSYPLKKDFPRTMMMMRLMRRHLSVPFFLNNKTIDFYGEKDAIMMAMMGCDLQQYLENFER